MDTARRLIRGQGWGPLATDRYCQGAEAAEKSTTHTHTHKTTAKPTFNHTLLCFHPLVFHFLIKERRLHVKDMPPPGASCSSCQCVYFCFFVVLFFSFFFFFWHLSPCSVGMSMLCPPSMTRASHSARWTSHLANLHSLHKS